MKTLSILRHAKAAVYDEYANDFQRPLAGRGPKDAVRMARILATLTPKPDWIISSPALRARQTAEAVAKELNLSHAMLWDERIYEASATTLLGVLQTAPEKAEHVVMIGHNPGLENLVAGLCAGGANGLSIYLPTAGLAHLASEIYYWNQMRWGAAHLRLLLAPKDVKALAK